MERQHPVAEAPNNSEILVAAQLRLFDNNRVSVLKSREIQSHFIGGVCNKRKADKLLSPAKPLQVKS